MACKACLQKRSELAQAVRQRDPVKVVTTVAGALRIIVEKQSEKSATVSKKRVATPEQS